MELFMQLKMGTMLRRAAAEASRTVLALTCRRCAVMTISNFGDAVFCIGLGMEAFHLHEKIETHVIHFGTWCRGNWGSCEEEGTKSKTCGLHWKKCLEILHTLGRGSELVTGVDRSISV